MRLLSTVFQHVSLEVARLYEGLGTLVASIRLLSTMYQHVSLEVATLLCESFVTLVANIMLVPIFF